MKKLIHILIMVILISMLYSTTPIYTGPFGLQMGLSVEQLKLVDPNAVQNNDYTWTITPPSPHPAFDTYVVKLHSTSGVFQIIALSNIIESDMMGTKLKIAFTTMVSGIASKYGQPTDKFDFLLRGSIWNEPGDFMMALLRKEYTLMTAWNLTSDEYINIITLTAVGVGSTSACIKLVYESKNAEAAIDKIHNEQDSAF